MREGFGAGTSRRWGERASLAGAGKSRARYAQRDGRLLGERLPVIVCLTWAKRAGNTYRVSFGCRNAGTIAMNTPRRLCGTMPPTHVSHPPTSFMTMWFSRRITRGSQLQSRHSGIGSIFSSKYGYARANMPVAFARAHDRLMCSNYARLHAPKYDGPMRSLPFLCSCCTETGPFRAISDRSRGAGVESRLAYLRRRRVLCTLPILQPCTSQHALHC